MGFSSLNYGDSIGGGPSKQNTNKHKHFGWDGVQDETDPSLGHTGLVRSENLHDKKRSPNFRIQSVR